jgi:hypothetical protein
MTKYLCLIQRPKRQSVPVYVDAEDRCEAAALAWFKVVGNSKHRPTVAIVDNTACTVDGQIITVMEA